MKRHVIVNYDIKTHKLGVEWNGYRIVMLSDFHNNSYGVDVDAVVRDVNEQHPDCIMIAGDIFTGKVGLDNKAAAGFLKKLSQNHKIYFGIGNHEQRLNADRKKYGSMYDFFLKTIEQCSIELLLNRTVRLKRGSTVMAVTGLEIDNNFYQKFKRVPLPLGYMKKTLGSTDREQFQVLLAHNPVYFREYAEWGADMILSGHLHGGMAKFPGIGGIIAPNYRLFPKYDSGKYEEYGSTMILGAGIGTHTINIRPFNPAEIVVITIYTCNT